MQISELHQIYLWQKIIIQWLRYNQLNQELFGQELAYNLLTLNSWELAIKARSAWLELVTLDLLSSIDPAIAPVNFKILLEWIQSYHLLCVKNNHCNLIEEFIPTIEHCYHNQSLVEESILAKNNYSCNPIVNKFSASNFMQELKLAAQWCSDKYALGRVGLVVFNLSEHYKQIDYIFSNYFAATAYKFNLKIPILEHEWFQIALLLLKIINNCLVGANIAYTDFSKLLTSKFILGGDLEFAERCYLDHLFRQKIDYAVNWSYLKAFLVNIFNDTLIGLDLFRKTINNFINFMDRLLAQTTDGVLKKNCNGWMEVANTILDMFGWQQFGSQIGSRELYLNWEKVLIEYQELDHLLKEHEFAVFIDLITKNLNLLKLDEQWLHVTTRTDQGSQIIINDFADWINLTEPFDYLWICGANQANLTKHQPYNIFLSNEIQQTINAKKINVVAGDLVYYLNYLISATKQQLVISYAELIDDLPSSGINFIQDWPVLNTITVGTNCDLNNLHTSEEKIFLERLPPANYTLPYDLSRHTGVNTLKLQIACPFQANAKVRLKVDPLLEPSKYFTKLQHSIILHKVLAAFWEQVQSQDQLKELSRELLYQYLSKISLNCLQDWHKLKPNSCNSVIVQLEHAKIVALCLEYITKIDLHRKPFKILHIEKEFMVNLQELLMKIRVDRVDQLIDGDRLIIDYKTSKVIERVNQLNSIWEDDPQLIIYSLVLPHIQGLLFARIRSTQITLAGLLADHQMIGEIADSMLLQLDDLKGFCTQVLTKINQIGADFINGYAAVLPKYAKNTCNKCDLHTFCRIRHYFSD